MNRETTQMELLAWRIDHPNRPLPKSLQKAVDNDPALLEEWRNIQGWANLLNAPDPWIPPEGFFERVAETAMREKRRAALTEPTRRELLLDPYQWGDLFSGVWARSYAMAAALLLLLTPVFWTGYHSYQTQGTIRFAEGHVIEVSGSSSPLRRDDRVRRGASIQTAANGQAILRLKGGVEACLDSRTQLTFHDSRTVELHRGRAHFDVAPSAKGFRVQTTEGEVMVLGTAFTVEAGENGSRVLVSRGRVRVAGVDRSIEVEQGHEGILNSSGAAHLTEARNLLQRTRWVTVLQEKSDYQELHLYYPSLAGPTPAN